MSEGRPGESGRDPGEPARNGDFQEAVARLERAVQELVVTARNQVSGRATALLDEATGRLERELGRRAERSRDPETATSPSEPSRRSRRRRHRHHRGRCSRSPDQAMPRRLYRDPARKRIVGVCAGIARYYRVEPWVVRCIAVTGLLFFPSIVFPAYWIAYFVMGTPPRTNAEPASGNGRHGRRDHRSPTPEFGPRLAPRYSLRNVQADLTEVELRLRRMETHVTSGRYELQRELRKIEGDGDGATA